MSVDRDALLFMAQVLDQTNRYSEMVDLMKRVVALNPVLSVNERNLLAVAYKNRLNIHRNGLRIMSAIGQHDDGTVTSWRVAQVAAVRSKVIDELNTLCLDFVNMIEQTLLPVTRDDESRMFFEKLRGDYYRYICETSTDDQLAQMTANARKAYEDAIEIGKATQSLATPGFLGLVLNYTVFLNEVVGSRVEATELAKKTYLEASTLIDNESEESYSEATMLLQILRDNITNWNEE
jgi:14-3-3 protein epsilon